MGSIFFVKKVAIRTNVLYNKNRTNVLIINEVNIMNTLIKKSTYVLLKIIAIIGFGVLFYFMLTNKMDRSSILIFSIMTSLSLLFIPGLKQSFLTEEEEYGSNY